MFCSKCGYEYLEDALFCQKCGNEILRKNFIATKNHITTKVNSVVHCPRCSNSQMLDGYGNICNDYRLVCKCQKCEYTFQSIAESETEVEKLKQKLSKNKLKYLLFFILIIPVLLMLISLGIKAWWVWIELLGVFIVVALLFFVVKSQNNNIANDIENKLVEIEELKVKIQF